MTPRQELIVRRRETKRLRKRFPQAPRARIDTEVSRRIRAIALLTPAMIEECLRDVL